MRRGEKVSKLGLIPFCCLIAAPPPARSRLGGTQPGDMLDAGGDAARGGKQGKEGARGGGGSWRSEAVREYKGVTN